MTEWRNEMKILVPTECSGSSRMGVRFTSLANNANIALGKQVKGDENTSFNRFNLHGVND